MEQDIEDLVNDFFHKKAHESVERMKALKGSDNDTLYESSQENARLLYGMKLREELIEVIQKWKQSQ